MYREQNRRRKIERIKANRKKDYRKDDERRKEQISLFLQSQSCFIGCLEQIHFFGLIVGVLLLLLWLLLSLATVGAAEGGTEG